MSYKAFSLLASLLIIAAFPLSTIAATQALKTSLTRGYTHLMCSSETDDGICESASSDIFAVVDGYENLTFFFYQEAGSGSTCEIYATGLRESTINNATDLSTFNANIINSSSLSSTLDKITFADIGFKYAWVECSLNGGTVSVEMIGSVGTDRLNR